MFAHSGHVFFLLLQSNIYNSSVCQIVNLWIKYVTPVRLGVIHIYCSTSSSNIASRTLCLSDPDYRHINLRVQMCIFLSDYSRFNENDNDRQLNISGYCWIIMSKLQWSASHWPSVMLKATISYRSRSRLLRIQYFIKRTIAYWVNTLFVFTVGLKLQNIFELKTKLRFIFREPVL